MTKNVLGKVSYPQKLHRYEWETNWFRAVGEKYDDRKKEKNPRWNGKQMLTSPLQSKQATQGNLDIFKASISA